MRLLETIFRGNHNKSLRRPKQRQNRLQRGLGLGEEEEEEEESPPELEGINGDDDDDDSSDEDVRKLVPEVEQIFAIMGYRGKTPLRDDRNGESDEEGFEGSLNDSSTPPPPAGERDSESAGDEGGARSPFKRRTRSKGSQVLVTGRNKGKALGRSGSQGREGSGGGSDGGG